VLDPLHVHDAPVTPCCPVGREPRKPCGARRRRNKTWGDHDPEWTAGDDAGPFTTALPVRISEPRTTGPPGTRFTSSPHGRGNFPRHRLSRRLSAQPPWGAFASNAFRLTQRRLADRAPQEVQTGAGRSIRRGRGRARQVKADDLLVAVHA